MKILGRMKIAGERFKGQTFEYGNPIYCQGEKLVVVKRDQWWTLTHYATGLGSGDCRTLYAALGNLDRIERIDLAAAIKGKPILNRPKIKFVFT